MIMTRKREGGAEIVGRKLCLFISCRAGINLVKFIEYTILFLALIRCLSLQRVAICPCHLQVFFAKKLKVEAASILKLTKTPAASMFGKVPKYLVIR